MTRILAVDPSTRSCGYAVFNRSKQVTLIESDYLGLPAKMTLQERLYRIHRFFEDIITTHRVSVLAIETPFFHRNAQTAMKLAMVRGVLYTLSYEYSLSLYEYAPREVKQAVTGWGGAPKDQVATVLYQLFPQLKSVARDDVSDAIAVGLTCIWRN